MKTTLAVLMVVGGLIAGCSSSEQHDKKTDKSTGKTTTEQRDDVYSLKEPTMAHQPEHEGTPISRGSARDDWNSIHSDPVCDMTVNPKTAPASEYYGGRIYYFDTVECQRRFHSNPSAYVPGDTYERRVQEVK